MTTVNVAITKRYRGQTYQERKIMTQYSVTRINAVSTGNEWTPPETPTNEVVGDTVIEFTETSTPTIIDYDINYRAMYGRYPKLMLLIYDEDYNELESIAKPIRTVVEDVLTTITWDLPEICDGKIIISK